MELLRLNKELPVDQKILNLGNIILKNYYDLSKVSLVSEKYL